MTRFKAVYPRFPVADLQRTSAFYRDVLGFTPGTPWPEDDPTFVILDRDDVSIQFYVSDAMNDDVEPGAMLSIDVDDAVAEHLMVSAKVEIEWGPEVYLYGRREFAIRDPDGYLVIISEETTDRPTVRE